MAWHKTCGIETPSGEVARITRDERFDDGECLSDLVFRRDGTVVERGKTIATLSRIEVEDWGRETDCIYRLSADGWVLESETPWRACRKH